MLVSCGKTDDADTKDNGESAAQPTTQAGETASGEKIGCEALGHTPEKANYQEAVACSVCGEMVGPLTPDFVTYGIVADLKVGETYDYKTICSNDPPEEIVGTLTVRDYKVVASDETHEAKEDYEWRIATFKIHFPFEHAVEHSYRYEYNMADYYNSRLMEDFWVDYEPVDGLRRTVNTFLVSYHGQEIECYRITKVVGG